MKACDLLRLVLTTCYLRQELKAQMNARGISMAGCLEKQDFVDKLSESASTS